MPFLLNLSLIKKAARQMNNKESKTLVAPFFKKQK